MSNKRYVLLKNEGEGPKTCAFFNSAAGCRNGAGCKFLHGSVPTAGSASPSLNQGAAAPPAPAVPQQVAQATLEHSNGSVLEGNSSASAPEKKKARKKARREAEVPLPSATIGDGTATTIAPVPVVVTPSPAPVPAPSAALPASSAPPAIDSSAQEEVLSHTQAKKKALREKALRRAAAAAARAEAEAARQASLVAPGDPVKLTAPATTAASPAAFPAAVAAASGSTTAPVAATQAPVALKSKKRRKREKTAEAAANGATMLANGSAVTVAPLSSAVAPVAPSSVSMPPPVASAAPAAAALAGTAAPPSIVLPVMPPTSLVAGQQQPASDVGAQPGKKMKKRKNKKSKAAVAAAAAEAAASVAATGVVGAPATALSTAVYQTQSVGGNVTMTAGTAATAAPALSTVPTTVISTAEPTKKVCAFFNKKKGCRSGGLCPFLHQGVERGGFGGTRGHVAKPPSSPAQPMTSTSELAPAPTPVPTSPGAALVASEVAVETGTAARPRKRCLFFDKPPGCTSGAACPFLHSDTAALAPGGVPPAVSPVAPTIQSVQQQQLLMPSVANPVAKQASVVVAPAAVAAPTIAATHAPQQTPETLRPLSASLPHGADVARATRKRGRSKTPGNSKRSDENEGGSGTSRLLAGLPVSPFVQPKPAMGGKTKTVKDAAVAAPMPMAPVGIPHPRADPWQILVDRTRSHPKFASTYRFASDSSWIAAAPCGDACSGLPQVVALDCEMCMTEDPVNKERNGKDLVRVSVIRGDNGDALIDTLVRPANAVLSWRSDIHGVHPKHLDGVLFTHRHAQAAMARICCKHTVMIGHALNNDLEALKMTHERVVDTSFLFEREGAPGASPSLRDLVMAVLGKEIQDGSHDSVTDAQCTLDVAKFALQNGPQAPVPNIGKKKHEHGDRGGGGHKRKWDVRGERRGEESGRWKRESALGDDRALTVHRLPLGTTEKQLLRVIEKKTKVIPNKADNIDFSMDFGKTQVYFASSGVAQIAFNSISTAPLTDSSGRLQKRIYTSEDGKSYIQVRQNKMIQNGDGLGLHFSSSSSEDDSDEDEDEEENESAGVMRQAVAGGGVVGAAAVTFGGVP